MAKAKARDGDTDESMRAVYQVLYSRYQSNTDLQWRLPGFVIALLAASIGGLLSKPPRVVAWGLGLGGAVIAVVGAMVMRRIEHTARWDRDLLDEYERHLLGDQPSLHLLHGSSFPARLRVRPPLGAKSRIHRWELRVSLLFPPSAMTFVLLLLTGALVLVLGAFEATGVIKP